MDRYKVSAEKFAAIMAKHRAAQGLNREDLGALRDFAKANQSARYIYDTQGVNGMPAVLDHLENLTKALTDSEKAAIEAVKELYSFVVYAKSIRRLLRRSYDTYLPVVFKDSSELDHAKGAFTSSVTTVDDTVRRLLKEVETLLGTDDEDVFSTWQKKARVHEREQRAAAQTLQDLLKGGGVSANVIFMGSVGPMEEPKCDCAGCVSGEQWEKGEITFVKHVMQSLQAFDGDFDAQQEMISSWVKTVHAGDKRPEDVTIEAIRSGCILAGFAMRDDGTLFAEPDFSSLEERVKKWAEGDKPEDANGKN